MHRKKSPVTGDRSRDPPTSSAVHATVWDNLLFLGCSTCFERYFRSSSGASKFYYSFWYYTRMSLPACIMGVLAQSAGGKIETNEMGMAYGAYGGG